MTSKRYLGLVLDETDRLFEQGAAGKNDDLVLAAGRIRGYALLASIEPEAEKLPAVRPIKNKPKKDRMRLTPSRKAVQDAAMLLSCPSCGAKVGEPCLALRSTSTAKFGDVLRYMHGERTGGNRSVPNGIRPRPENNGSSQPWPKAVSAVSAVPTAVPSVSV